MWKWKGILRMAVMMTHLNGLMALIPQYNLGLGSQLMNYKRDGQFAGKSLNSQS
jgi:hypothetical protein